MFNSCLLGCLLILFPLVILWILKLLKITIFNKGLYYFANLSFLFIILRTIFVTRLFESPTILCDYLQKHTVMIILAMLLIESVSLLITWVVKKYFIIEYNNTKKNPWFLIISCIIGIIGMILLVVELYVTRTFGKISFLQLLFAVFSPIQGVDTGQIIRVFINPLPFIIMGCIFIISLAIYKYNFKIANRVIINKIVFRKVYSWVLLFLGVIGFINFNNAFNIPYFFKQVAKQSSFIKDNYINPNNVNISLNGKKRNLIHIYVESLENSYTDKQHGGAFDQDIIPELRALQQEGISFSNQNSKDVLGGAFCLEGTQWTIAGMTATEMGIPLKSDLSKRNEFGSGQSFLPGAIGLGNILKAAGYHNQVMLGSDAVFANRDKFFKQHDYDLFDNQMAKEMGLLPPDHEVFWGMGDQQLFKYVKEALNILAKQSQPFNLTTLTTSMHAPEGYHDPSLPSIFGSNYLDSVYYNQKDIVDLIRWCQAQSWYKNTTIIITGDHISMNGDVMSDINVKDPNYKRTIYNLFLNTPTKPAPGALLNRGFATMDFFPTILASLGFEIENNQLGLGTNLFSGQPTIIEKYGVDMVQDQLTQLSAFYNNTFVTPPQRAVYNKQRLKINGKSQ